jgi:hypothetical protein
MAVPWDSVAVFMPPNGKRMRFHNFRDLSPARTGVEGLRSHSLGKALKALMGVKLKELSVEGFVASLEEKTLV